LAGTLLFVDCFSFVWWCMVPYIQHVIWLGDFLILCCMYGKIE
jgi:hypothetical protein